ncbi:SDR family NAD(P)-dependent oxidoreductase [Williamsia sterculiae]|uniref:Short-chain dehydrogenase n=1 Tax=Williamsia sterculiae TaxID=1344003 RepID=A0A1N7H5D6_9NOCA|nr:SDR family NAD(P)-dependent oxidoreductase [Williamsia sterculiae]SIS20033.1 Short-chain dehydrogenase [Williamsia sterculiae]
MGSTHQLDGRRVLITGASSGIGRSLAKRLAAEGAQLAIAARRTELLDDVAREIARRGHPRPVVLTADLSRPGVAATLATRTLAELSGVDILINNAGVSVTGTVSTLGDGSAARAVIETNLWSPMALGAALSPTMVEQGHGTIVNVTSTIQSIPLPLLAYYAASKSALAQATTSLRGELAGTGVQVLEVIPGGTDTALRDIDELPWKGKPPATIPPVSADRVAAAIVRAIKRAKTRLAYPSYVLLPTELPAIGRLMAGIGGRRVDLASTTRQLPEDRAGDGTD